MTKKVLAVFAAAFIFSFLAMPAQALDLDPAFVKTDKEGVSTAQTGLEELCKQQQLKIQTLEGDREKMVYEIQRLHDEIRRLNETLDKIRREVGNSEPRPTSLSPFFENKQGRTELIP